MCRSRASRENEKAADGSHPPVWFALTEDRPLTCFAGILDEGWQSVRKVKDGETTDDLYAFLTTEPTWRSAPCTRRRCR